MKKLLILGGDHFTIPVVEAAKKQGYYTITCDYLPDNVAHRMSDEYLNFSTTDKDGILEWSRDNKIDGIVTFTDSGVVTTAYVREHLGLPMLGPLESVEILQNKAKFREFLEKNNFNVPKARGYSKYEDALADKDYYKWPIIVKPVDSAASKGVTRVDDIENLETAVKYALENSSVKNFIVEEFIEKEGCSSDSDCFSVNGKLVVCTFSAQRFDENASNPYAPASFSWPSTFTKKQESELTNELQRLMTLLKMQTTIYNVESRVGQDGKTYIMEVSPRGGGNRLAEMVRFSTGADLITAAVRAAVGDSVELIPKPLNGHWAEIILHAEKSGKFDEIVIDKYYYKEYIRQVDLWIRKGDNVDAFTGGNKAIGTLVLKFPDESTMLQALVKQNEWLKVIVK